MPDDELSALLSGARFGTARFDNGYVRADVDVLVTRLQAAAAADHSIGAVIATATLGMAGFREGYEVSQVDEFLRRIAQAAGGEIGREILARGEVRHRDIPGMRDSRPRVPEAPDAAPARGVIEERPGLLDRLRRHRS